MFGLLKRPAGWSPAVPAGFRAFGVAGADDPRLVRLIAFGFRYPKGLRALWANPKALAAALPVGHLRRYGGFGLCAPGAKFPATAGGRPPAGVESLPPLGEYPDIDPGGRDD
jgi:hypothetical protein